MSDPIRKRIVLEIEMSTETSDPNAPEVLRQVRENFKALAVCGYMNGYAHDVDDLYIEPVAIGFEGGPMDEINVHALRGGDAQGAVADRSCKADDCELYHCRRCGRHIIGPGDGPCETCKIETNPPNSINHSAALHQALEKYGDRPEFLR